MNIKWKIFFKINLLLFIVSSSCYRGIGQAIDSAYIQCIYSYAGIQDSSNIDMKKHDQFILRIGKDIADFYSYNSFRVDSLVNNDIINGASAIEMMANRKKYGNPGYHYHILLNYPNGKLTFTDRLVTQRFKYEDDLEAQQWHILQDTSVILKYKVQKATCSFGGRNWIVWFAPDIPISFGPWKFNGLPGLILSARDDKNYFHFDIIGLNYLSRKTPIMFDLIKKEVFENVTKNELLKLEYKMNTDPLGFVNENTGIKIQRADGSSVPKRNYTPIELY